jgi:serine/threonine protein kinase
VCRGVGCIFAEMISGLPLFPGLKDSLDQVVRIWQVLGTPNEQTWPGVRTLPEFKKSENKLDNSFNCSSDYLKQKQIITHENCKASLSVFATFDRNIFIIFYSILIFDQSMFIRKLSVVRKMKM